MGCNHFCALSMPSFSFVVFLGGVFATVPKNVESGWPAWQWKHDFILDISTDWWKCAQTVEWKVSLNQAVETEGGCLPISLRIYRPRMELHSGLPGTTSQTLALDLSASPALWRCGGMHRMPVMPVSFVMQSENGISIHKPLNHKKHLGMFSGKKKIPSSITVNQLIPY